MNSSSTKGRSKPGALPKETLRHEVAEVYRRAIFDAAERVFGAHGFAEGKMVEIAEAAGVASGSLYNHFASKEDLFRALAEHRSGAFLLALTQTAQTSGDVEEVLVQLVRRTFEEFESHGAFFAVVMQAGDGVSQGQRSCGPLVERNRERFLGALEQVLLRAVDQGQFATELTVSELAAALAGAVSSMAMLWFQTGRKTKITERAGFLVRLFLNGAMKR